MNFRTKRNPYLTWLDHPCRLIFIKKRKRQCETGKRKNLNPKLLIVLIISCANWLCLNQELHYVNKNNLHPITKCKFQTKHIRVILTIRLDWNQWINIWYLSGCAIILFTPLVTPLLGSCLGVGLVKKNSGELQVN